MAKVATRDWYDIARDTNWTPTYVAEDEMFPPQFSDPYGIPLAEWETFDEPYKITFRDYVQSQREKDVGAYSVKSAIARTEFYRKASPGWKSLLQLHFGAVSFTEYGSVSAFARMSRFARAPGMRNMANFGSLDEIRHAQIQMYFAYEFIGESRAFDWAQKAVRTNNWVVISERHCFDDIEHTRDVISAAIMTNFSFEQAFTNLQFVALSADAKKYGDYSFATMLQTIQSDEARHAQIGEPLIEIMLRNGRKAEAQKLIDISFWRIWKQFSVLSGVSMDYYTPLEQRELSFKEFVKEFVGNQFLRNIQALGLEKPWYWDEYFLPDIDVYHHAQQIGIYLYRATEWWDVIAGVSPAERQWLESKYPGWNDTFGQVWDVITENILAGRLERTEPKLLPMMCNMVGFELTGVPGKKWDVRDCQVDYEGRRYHFGHPVDKWIFEQEPKRYKNHMGFIDRIVRGIVPAGPDGVFDYMNMGEADRGNCGENFAWAESYRRAAE
ncbi:YHS domain-containing protein [Zavarzinia aquatilis]|uniref:Toluene monooxygenase n=1 Tax=Zavarzinia aquatilis TaxID=2211142 RepID=A0A317E046_9PROT|nr:YHS domain-containing protein [Zavarzinia aquatilis]PWR19506.1 toluene monooxygenase [Zavarzinia aquatilis]